MTIVFYIFKYYIRYFEREVLEHAFGEQDNGREAVMVNATIAQLLQEMR